MNLELLFEVSLYGAVGFAAILVILASVYDVRSTAHHDHTVIRRRLSHCTVLVYMRNDTTTINACLQSIVDAQLPDYDIVVAVDALSHEGNRHTVRDYQLRYPDVPVRLYAQRKTSNRSMTLHQAYKRSQRGQVVFVLDADSRIDAGLRQSVGLFATDTSIAAIRLPVAVTTPSALSSVIYYFLTQNQHIYSKAMSFVRHQAVPFGRTGCLYRVEYQLPVGLITARYEALGCPVRIARKDFMRPAQPVVRPYRLRGVVGLLLIGWLLAMCAWAAWLAATLQISAPLLTVWAVATVWLGVLAVFDHDNRLVDRLYYLFCIPIFSFVLYVYSVGLYGVVVARAVIYQSMKTGVCASSQTRADD